MRLTALLVLLPALVEAAHAAPPAVQDPPPAAPSAALPALRQPTGKPGVPKGTPVAPAKPASQPAPEQAAKPAPKPDAPKAAAVTPAKPTQADLPSDALHLALAPGAPKDALRRLLLKPYETATGTQIGDAAWDGTLTPLTKLANDHAADLVLTDGATLAAGCSGQVFDKLDWSRLGRSRFVASTASDCGAGAYVDATILAWDRTKFASGQQAAPAGSAQLEPGWGEFWDVAKYPGRRGLARTARGTLEIALLADGVAPGDIYRTLRSADGLDRAFRKLDQLKPYIQWWDQPGLPAQLLGTGKVLMTSAPASSIALAQGKPAQGPNPQNSPGMQWKGSLVETKAWAIVHGTAHPAAAVAALLIATDPAREAEFARATGLGPSTAEASSLLPAAVLAASPSAPDNLKAGLAVDEGFWQENHVALEGRFAAWVGK